MTYQAFYLIYGFFWQVKNSIANVFNEVGELQAALIETTEPSMFSGSLNTFSDNGSLSDKYGSSIVLIKEIKDDKFSFLKSYDVVRQGYIEYNFFKKGDGYVGYWISEKNPTIRGLAKCFIKGINYEEFFDYQKTIEEVKEFLPVGFFEKSKFTNEVKVSVVDYDEIPPDDFFEAENKKWLQEHPGEKLPDGGEDLPF